MKFPQKLDAVMQALGVSNKTLAGVLHVDASLVSRWRSGSRLPARNSSYIRQISDYIHRVAAEEYQKVAVLALMGLPLDSVSDHKTHIGKLVYAWLSQSDQTRSQMEIADSFLQHADGIDGTRRRQPDSHLKAPLGSVRRAETFCGDTGMRDASVKLLLLSLASGKPQTVNLFSDQSLAWLNLNPAHDREWCSLLQQCIDKGDTVQVVHNIERNSYELFTILKRWMPMYLTGRVKTFYNPRHLATIHCHTLNVIPGLAALSSTCYTGAEFEAEVRLFTDEDSVASIQRTFIHILHNSLPLIHIYRPEDYRESQQLHMDFSKKDGDNISMINMLSNFSSPESLFSRVLSRQPISDSEKAKTLSQFRLKQTLFHEGLLGNRYTEILSLPEPQQLKDRLPPYNMAIILGHNDAAYENTDEFKAHIANVIHLLETHENYLCVLQKRSPFRNVQIQAREKVGVLLTKDSGSLFSFYMTQPTMSQAFYDYLENTVHNFSAEELDRKSTIRKLEAYLEI